MNIIRKDKKRKNTFGDMLTGAVFDYQGDAFVKIYDLESVEYSAVYLECGTVVKFSDNTEVIPLEAELIVRGVME